MAINTQNMPRDPMAAQQVQNSKPAPTVLPEWFTQKIGETEVRHWNDLYVLREQLKASQAKIEELTTVNATVGKQLAEKAAELQKYIDTYGETTFAQGREHANMEG